MTPAPAGERSHPDRGRAAAAAALPWQPTGQTVHLDSPPALLLEILLILLLEILLILLLLLSILLSNPVPVMW